MGSRTQRGSYISRHGEEYRQQRRARPTIGHATVFMPATALLPRSGAAQLISRRGKHTPFEASASTGGRLPPCSQACGEQTSRTDDAPQRGQAHPPMAPHKVQEPPGWGAWQQRPDPDRRAPTRPTALVGRRRWEAFHFLRAEKTVSSLVLVVGARNAAVVPNDGGRAGSCCAPSGAATPTTLPRYRVLAATSSPRSPCFGPGRGARGG